LPLRLEKPTIEEAVFEIRFQPASSSVVSLLPGLVFAKLGSEYPESESLPLASLPPEIRTAEPALRYQQQIRLSGRQGSVFFGDCVAGVSLLAPYPGWEAFRPRVNAFLDVLQSSKLVRAPERLSIKFVNLLTDTPSRTLDSLNVEIRLGGEPSADSGLHLRAELNQPPYRSIVEIAPEVIVKLGGNRGSKSGLLLSIDCIRIVTEPDFWAETDNLIEGLHRELRNVFFKLLTDDSIARLGPIYQDTTSTLR